MEKQADLELINRYFPDLTARQQDQMAMLGPLYREWNEKINLISRKDMDALYERHVLHSLAIARIIRFGAGAEVLDIGTGGGFPGIPLAVLFPDVQFTLVDSIGKKIRVVREVAAAAGIRNVRAVQGRVEELRGMQFDYAVSRAVAPLESLWKWVSPMLRKGAHTPPFSAGLFCLKGGDLEEEISRSGLNVQTWPLEDIFDIGSLSGKYVLYSGR